MIDRRQVAIGAQLTVHNNDKISRRQRQATQGRIGRARDEHKQCHVRTYACFFCHWSIAFIIMAVYPFDLRSIGVFVGGEAAGKPSLDFRQAAESEQS